MAGKDPQSPGSPGPPAGVVPPDVAGSLRWRWLVQACYPERRPGTPHGDPTEGDPTEGPVGQSAVTTASTHDDSRSGGNSPRPGRTNIDEAVPTASRNRCDVGHSTVRLERRGPTTERRIQGSAWAMISGGVGSGSSADTGHRSCQRSANRARTAFVCREDTPAAAVPDSPPSSVRQTLRSTQAAGCGRSSRLSPTGMRPTGTRRTPPRTPRAACRRADHDVLRAARIAGPSKSPSIGAAVRFADGLDAACANRHHSQRRCNTLHVRTRG